MMNTQRNFVFAVGLASMVLAGCTCHSTGSTEIGVVTKKIALVGKAGVQDQVYEPGATYFFAPLTTDWHTFDVSIQNLAMTKTSSSRKVGDRNDRGQISADDGIRFKTMDGNDIRVDVTVVWQIDPKKASHVLQFVGDSTRQVEDKLVRPACRSVVRDVLNQLHSEDFYVSEKRFQKANDARDQLARVLAPEGIIVSQVILGEHNFHPEYEQVIRDKKLAEQNSERLRSEAKAAAEEAKSKLEIAKGQVSQQLAQAAGFLDTVKLRSDAEFYQAQKRAEAILTEKKAQAQGIKKDNEAMAGAGGKTMVKLKLAEAMAGKEIVFLPSGGQGGMNMQTLNLNALLKSYGPPEAPSRGALSEASGP